MSYHIIWKKLDGTLSIDNVSPSFDLAATVAFKDSRIAKKVRNPVDFVAIVESRDIPTDRYFRDAWRFDPAKGKFEFDLPTCRERHMNKLRRERDLKLAESDPHYLKALESGDATAIANIKARRTELRDMPVTLQPQFALAPTPEAIRAIRPAFLDTPL